MTDPTPVSKKKRKPSLKRAERSVMKALVAQTKELETYSSTPHTEENQSRIMGTLTILRDIRELQGDHHGGY